VASHSEFYLVLEGMEEKVGMVEKVGMEELVVPCR